MKKVFFFVQLRIRTIIRIRSRIVNYVLEFCIMHVHCIVWLKIYQKQLIRVKYRENKWRSIFKHTILTGCFRRKSNCNESRQAGRQAENKIISKCYVQLVNISNCSFQAIVKASKLNIRCCLLHSLQSMHKNPSKHWLSHTYNMCKLFTGGNMRLFHFISSYHTQSFNHVIVWLAQTIRITLIKRFNQIYG